MEKLRVLFFGILIFISIMAIGVGINHYIPLIQDFYFSFIKEESKGTLYLTEHIPLLYSKHSFVVPLHALTGTVMIALWPAQFIKKFRHKLPQTHRVLGLIFFLCAVCVGITAFYIGLKVPFAGISETISTTLVVMVYLYCIYKALLSIKLKKFKDHGHWNLRIIALSLGIISQRMLFVNELFISNNLDVKELFVLTALLGFFGNLAITELAIRKVKL